MWTCSLHIVGNLLKDSICVSYLLLQVSDSSFVSLRRASNLPSDNCADASLLSIINSLFHWLLFSYNNWEQTLFQNKIVNHVDLKLWKSIIVSLHWRHNNELSMLSLLILFVILLIFAYVFCFKYLNMHIPAQHCKWKLYIQVFHSLNV